MTTIQKTCEAIETFFETCRDDGIELYDDELEPQSEKAIAAAEKKLGLKFPDAVRAFLKQGFSNASGTSSDEPFASMGFAFLGAEQIADHTQMLRDVAKDDSSKEHARVIQEGFAITYEEPEIVVSTDGVYHFSFRNPLLKVADSFEQFLTAWFASGCFTSHNFKAHWKRVSKLVKSSTPPRDNVWVRAYQKQFPEG